MSAYNAPAPAYPGSLTSSSLILPISLPPYPTPGVLANNTPNRHIFALPMPRSRMPSNTSVSSVDDPSSRAVGHIGGILAILCLAGCIDEHGVHSEPLRARFGEKLLHIANLTETLGRMLHEGVSSAWSPQPKIQQPHARCLRSTSRHTNQRACSACGGIARSAKSNAVMRMGSRCTSPPSPICDR